MGLYLGLISGTSMDAIDAVLVDFDVAPLRIIATGATSFEPALKSRISALIERADGVALDEVGQIDVELARAFAQAARNLMHSAGVSAGRVAAIGSPVKSTIPCSESCWMNPIFDWCSNSRLVRWPMQCANTHRAPRCIFAEAAHAT